MKILILADDLTGAADCAVGFAMHGFRTQVLLKDCKPETAPAVEDVLAFDTNSRSLSAQAASATVVECWQSMARAPVRLYKKMDSTLRGHWATEVGDLRRAGAGMAIVAPAFPATGRTTKGGRQFLHGKLLAADEPVLDRPPRSADIRATLASRGLQTEHLSLQCLRKDPKDVADRLAALARAGIDAVVCDGESANDLRAVAKATMRLEEQHFWVGSAGLGRELAGLIDGSRVIRPEPPTQPPCDRVLAVVGTPAPVSQRQARTLADKSQIEQLQVPVSLLRSDVPSEQWREWRERIGRCASRADLLVRVEPGAAPAEPAQGPGLSRRLAELLRSPAQAADGLLLTGGDTARALFDALGVNGLEVRGELQPGVVLSSALAGPRALRVVTKAGAFGTETTLLDAYLHLKGVPKTFPNFTARSPL